jgi:hypothetical protein
VARAAASPEKSCTDKVMWATRRAPGADQVLVEPGLVLGLLDAFFGTDLAGSFGQCPPILPFQARD